MSRRRVRVDPSGSAYLLPCSARTHSGWDDCVKLIIDQCARYIVCVLSVMTHIRFFCFLYLSFSRAIFFPRFSSHLVLYFSRPYRFSALLFSSLLLFSSPFEILSSPLNSLLSLSSLLLLFLVFFKSLLLFLFIFSCLLLVLSDTQGLARCVLWFSFLGRRRCFFLTSLL